MLFRTQPDRLGRFLIEYGGTAGAVELEPEPVLRPSDTWETATDPRTPEAVRNITVAALLDGLEHQLATQPVIEQSKGILMGHGIDSDAAFDVLRRWSWHTNLKLTDTSRILVAVTAKPRRSVASQPGSDRFDHLF